MIQAWYKALELGVSKLIKNGLAFTVLACCIVGLVWIGVEMDDRHFRDMSEMKADMREMKKEHAEQLNIVRREAYELRNEIALCHAARERQAGEIATLKALVHKLKR